jgi:hypothetical protein
MWKGQGRSGYGESSTGGDYDDWSCLSRNGRQWKNPATMLTRDLSGADYWHIRKQMTDSYDVPLEVYAENDTVNLAHTLPNGKANLLAYADKAPVVKPKVSIKDKILPQAKRLTILREQMVELEKSYRNDEMSISEYSLLRDVIVAKIERQEVLLKKAVSVRPIRTETEEVGVETAYETCDVDYSHTEVATSCGVSWIDELSPSNSFKKILQITCTVAVKLVHFSQRAKAYYQTLKEV